MIVRVFVVAAFYTFSNLIYGQAGTRIAYIDMNYILENIEEYSQASSQLEQRVERWKNDIQEKQSKIDQLRKNLSYEKILLTKELAEEREKEIEFYENDLVEYQKKRFGPKGDYEIQQSTLVKPIQDLVFDAVTELSTSKKYDIVLDRSEVSMVYASQRLDISDDVLARIKNSIEKTKSSNKK